MDKGAGQLQKELSLAIGKAERLRKALRICRVSCYGVILLYIIYTVVFPSFWNTNLILALAIPLSVLLVSTAGLALLGYNFTRREQHSVSRLLRKIFPDANCDILTFELYPSLINASFFFGNFDYALSLGTLAFRHNGQRLEVKDILVNQNIGMGVNLWNMEYRRIFNIFRNVFGGIFTYRIENTPSSFRGMFAHTRIGRNIHCGITVLPAGISERKDYLAKTYNAVIHVKDNVQIECGNEEFEQYFKVYTTNEYVARLIVTPSMTSKLVELKKKYKRDVMVSFVGDLFFFAVHIPEGFITSGNSPAAVKDLEDLHDCVATARSILNDLNLEKIPPKA